MKVIRGYKICKTCCTYKRLKIFHSSIGLVEVFDVGKYLNMTFNRSLKILLLSTIINSNPNGGKFKFVKYKPPFSLMFLTLHFKTILFSVFRDTN